MWIDRFFTRHLSVGILAQREMIRFWDQDVKGQGHSIIKYASSQVEACSSTCSKVSCKCVVMTLTVGFSEVESHVVYMLERMRLITVLPGVTESLSQVSLSETGLMPSLSQLITVGCQLQHNLTHLLVSTISLSV